MRIYLPATLDDLQSPQGLTPRVSYGATETLKSAVPDEDDEGWEFIAFLAAGDAAIESASASRIVVAADVTGGTEANSVAAIESTQVSWDQVSSIHIDDPSYTTLRDDLRAARNGDEPARGRVNEADLLWYDVVEREQVITLLKDLDSGFTESSE